MAVHEPGDRPSLTPNGWYFDLRPPTLQNCEKQISVACKSLSPVFCYSNANRLRYPTRLNNPCGQGLCSTSNSL